MEEAMELISFESGRSRDFFLDHIVKWSRSEYKWSSCLVIIVIWNSMTRPGGWMDCSDIEWHQHTQQWPPTVPHDRRVHARRLFYDYDIASFPFFSSLIPSITLREASLWASRIIEPMCPISLFLCYLHKREPFKRMCLSYCSTFVRSFSPSFWLVSFFQSSVRPSVRPLVPLANLIPLPLLLRPTFRCLVQFSS